MRVSGFCLEVYCDVVCCCIDACFVRKACNGVMMLRLVLFLVVDTCVGLVFRYEYEFGVGFAFRLGFEFVVGLEWLAWFRFRSLFI